MAAYELSRAKWVGLAKLLKSRSPFEPADKLLRGKEARSAAVGPRETSASEARLAKQATRSRERGSASRPVAAPSAPRMRSSMFATRAPR